MTKLETVAIMAASIYPLAPASSSIKEGAVKVALDLYDEAQRQLIERGDIPEPAKYEPTPDETVDNLPWKAGPNNF